MNFFLILPIFAVLSMLAALPMTESAEGYTYDAPLQQQNVGATLHDIVCNTPQNLYLLDWQTPLCLHTATYESLIGRELDIAPAAGHANIDSYMMISSQNARHTLEMASTTYDANGGGQKGLESLTGSYDGLYYPYVLDFDANVVAHGIYPRAIGPPDLSVSLRGPPERYLSVLAGDIGPLSIDATQSSAAFEEITTALSDDGDHVWIEHYSDNPLTRQIDLKRSLLVLHDGYIFGSGYYLDDFNLTSALNSIFGSGFRTIDNRYDVQTIKIGALVPPLERPGGAGVMRMLATSIAEDDFNAYLKGKGSAWRIDVDIRHTHPGTDEPLEAMMSFNDDGISLVAGPSASSSVLAIKPYADENDMTILSCCSTSPALAINDDSVFRLAPDDTLQGPVIAEILINDGRNLLIPIWRDDVWGSGLADSVIQRFEARGGLTDASVGTYKLCSDDGCYDTVFSEMVSTLNMTVHQYIDQGIYNADEIGIVFIGSAETIDFLRMASGYDILDDVRWFGSDSVAQNAEIISAGTSGFAEEVGFRAAIFAADTTSERHVRLTDRLAEHTDLEPNVYVYSSYDAVWVIGLAIEAAGSQDDPLLVRAQIPEVARMHDAAIGPIFLNDAGDSVKAAYNVWIVIDNKWMHAGTYSEAIDSVDPLQ